MEMYADPNGRGGVLEPSGTVSVKFRAHDIVKAAHRLDPILQQLDRELAKGDKLTEEQRKDIGGKTKARETQLINVYQQVAEHFADLHDTPGRMVSKGVIRKVVEWKKAREFFYWRLRRRLKEGELGDQIAKASGGMPKAQRSKLLQTWFSEANRQMQAERGNTSSGGGLTAQLLQMVGAPPAPPKPSDTKDDQVHFILHGNLCCLIALCALAVGR